MMPSKPSMWLVAALAVSASAYAGPATLTLYPLDYEQAKDIARQVMIEAHGANKISEQIERARTTFTVSGGGVLRSGWSWGLSVMQASGLTPEGRVVSGMRFEPYAAHGPTTGKAEYTEAMSDTLLAAAITRADKSSKGIAVVRLLAADAEVQLSNEGDEIAARLRALKSLLDSGAITAAEYEAKKKELLARF